MPNQAFHFPESLLINIYQHVTEEESPSPIYQDPAHADILIHEYVCVFVPMYPEEASKLCRIGTQD